MKIKTERFFFRLLVGNFPITTDLYRRIYGPKIYEWNSSSRGKLFGKKKSLKQNNTDLKQNNILISGKVPGELSGNKTLSLLLNYRKREGNIINNNNNYLQTKENVVLRVKSRLSR